MIVPDTMVAYDDARDPLAVLRAEDGSAFGWPDVEQVVSAMRAAFSARAIGWLQARRAAKRLEFGA